MEKGVSEDSVTEGGLESGYESGSDMFGFSNPKVAKLIQVCCFIISSFLVLTWNIKSIFLKLVELTWKFCNFSQGDLVN